MADVTGEVPESSTDDIELGVPTGAELSEGAAGRLPNVDRREANREDLLDDGESGASPYAAHARRLVVYAAKAAVVLGLLGIFAVQAPAMPPIAIALIWSALSAACSLGTVHQCVMRKLRRQIEFKEGGRAARFNNGRTLCFIVSFVVSAIGVASLMFAVATWDAVQWCLAVAAVPLLAVASHVVGNRLKEEFEPAFWASRSLLVGVGITLAALVVGALVISAIEPTPQVTSAAQAFKEAPQPFDGSPSALMSEAGRLIALVDGLSSFGLSQAAVVNLALYRVVHGVLMLASFGALVGIFATCLLDPAELKRVFLPLEAAKDPSRPQPLMCRYVAAACVAPAVLAVGFLAADHAAAYAVQTQEVTAAEAFVRDQVDLAVFVLDGQYYEYQGVQDLMSETSEKAAQLEADARAELVPLVNGFFDGCLGNVDAFLDWYYSLLGDYEQLAMQIAQYVAGSTDDYAVEQLTSHLEDGFDDAGLSEKWAGYQEQAAALEDDFYARMAELKFEDDVPDWLVKKSEVIEREDLLKVFAPAQSFMSREMRVVAGGTAGVATGVATKTLVSKAADKGFFKGLTKLVEKVAAKVGTRAAEAAVGSAIGGAVGAVGGSAVPVAGTAVGGAAGAVAGAAIVTGVGIGVDYGLLKVDELLNRDAYRQEIVDSIEDARAEMLATIEPADEGGENEGVASDSDSLAE